MRGREEGMDGERVGRGNEIRGEGGGQGWRVGETHWYFDRHSIFPSTGISQHKLMYVMLFLFSLYLQVWRRSVGWAGRDQ